MFNNLIKLSTFIVVYISSVFTFEINMNTLHLTAADGNSVVNNLFEAYGMNYETQRLPLQTPLTLESGNVGLYNSIVIEDATQEMLASINSQILDYQKKYKIRIVYLNSEPNPSDGFTSVNKVLPKKTLTLTAQGLELAKKYQMKGENVVFEISDCVYNIATSACDPYYHYEVGIGGQNITPLLKYEGIEAYGGAIVKNGDAEAMYFFTTNVESTIAYFIGHLWVSWSNYGIIDGYRRLHFVVQIDDFFINNQFNYTAGTEYRTSVDDMKNIAQWQKDIVEKRMPAGSAFKIELAFNGYHVLVNANHPHTYPEDWTLFNKPRDFVKPLNEEGSKHYVNPNPDTNWDESLLKQNDKLYEYFAKNSKAQDDFYWLTHTFSHQNLDYVSLHDADMEISLNNKMAGKEYLDMYDRDCYSKGSIVCPEISGLHNGHTLQAFDKNGVKYAVGDTSRADLSPGNFYLPMVTNTTTSNFDGFLVIPRQPPQIYWDCSTVEQNMQYYRFAYNRDIDWATHLKEERELHIKNFLKLRHDPYMFHEGNLRNADRDEVEVAGVRGKFGLMQQWVENMVGEIKRYLDWPLISLKMDDLAQTYIKRLNQKSCSPKYTMVIDDSSLKISEIKISSSTGECEVPLFAIRDTGFDSNNVKNVEQIGNEPQTAWITATTTPKSIKFSTEMKWNDDTFTGKNIKQGLSNNNKNNKESSSSSFNYKKWMLIGVIVIIVALVGYLAYLKMQKSKKNNINEKRSNKNYAVLNY